MPITKHTNEFDRRFGRDRSFGPQLAFLATVTVAGFAIVTGQLPSHLTMPAISTMLFVLAAVFALVAWIRCSTDEYGVTYWDVSGALVLIGVGAAALIEPDQLVRLVADLHTE